MASTPSGRRIEDRIHELAARIASASKEELDHIHIELRAVMNEYTRRRQKRSSATTIDWPDLPYERRVA